MHIGEFVTSEFGEAAVRRRVCLVATPGEMDGNPLEFTTRRSKLAPPMSPHLDATKASDNERWIGPVKVTMDGGADDQRPFLVGRQEEEPCWHRWSIVVAVEGAT